MLSQPHRLPVVLGILLLTSATACSDDSEDTRDTTTGGVAGTTGGVANTGGFVANTGGIPDETGGMGGTGGAIGASGGTGGIALGGAGGAGGDSTGGTPGQLTGDIVRGNSFVLEFDGVYFESVEAGGQIVAFGPAEGTNLLVSSGSYTGSTLWTSPQTWSWPPTTFEGYAYPATVAENTITMSGSQVATLASGNTVTLTKAFSPNFAHGGITIDYTVELTTGTSETLALWEVTRVPSGGLTFWPGTATDTSAAACGDGNTSITADISSGYVWFDQATHGDPCGKLLSDSTAGWMAHTDGTHLFVKAWADVLASQQVAGEAEVEVYDGESGPYVEVEVQGPETTLSVGDSTTFTVTWIVAPLGTASAAIGNAELMALAESLVP